ncbi:MAG: TolB family protein, partial [Longimicrobiales bacterium]
MRRVPILFAPLLLAVPAIAPAQETPSDTLLTVDHYLDWETVGDPQISPDGSQVIYTRRWVNKLEDEWTSSLWITNADGSKNRFLVDGSNARWSPDGTRIVYLADGEPEGSQIWVRWMDAEGAATQVTRVLETPSQPLWSPDGRSIAFTMLASADESDELKIDMPSAPDGAEWTEAPRIVSRMHFRADRRGFLENGYNHLFVVPAEGGTPRQLTSGEWNVGARYIGIPSGTGYDWTPDGGALVFDGLRGENTDMSYAESAIYVLDIESGDIRQVTQERGFWTDPHVSPDGRTVVFTGYPYTIQTYHVAELYAIGLDGSGMRMITPELDRPVNGITWAADGGSIYFAVDDEGTRNVFAATLDGTVRPVTEGEHLL